jgi:membrane protease YdiL (CAAX protease family)
LLIDWYKEGAMGILKKNSLFIGLILMFALTWPFYQSLGLFVGYGLAAGALISTGLMHGFSDIKRLLRRFLIWRVKFRWYMIALILPFILYALAAAASVMISGGQFDFSRSAAVQIFGSSNQLWLFVIPFFLVDLLTNGEELAWRGFVLPRLQSRNSALLSSILLGAVWGLWHLPKFLPTGDWLLAGNAVLHNIAISVIFSWIYNSTGGSLLLASLLHAAFNTTYVFLPINASDPLVLAALLILEIIAAMLITWISGPLHLANEGTKIVMEDETIPAVLRA